MASPFPGMDPYLETMANWPTFQHNLIVSLYQLIQPGIADRYRVKLATRHYTTELILFTSIQREPQTEDFIEIRNKSDDKLVTVINVLSPINKSNNDGKKAYLETRQQAITVRAGCVEIDLLTQGQPPLVFDRVGLPKHQYTVVVNRPASLERFEVYPGLIKARLPRFKMPLAADDRDTVVDLQMAVNRAYDLTDASTPISYASLPSEVNFSDEDRDWIKQLVN
jgi:hypothetical protein